MELIISFLISFGFLTGNTSANHQNNNHNKHTKTTVTNLTAPKGHSICGRIVGSDPTEGQ